MTTHEIIKNHEGVIFFYPFSGSHFEIIEKLNSLIPSNTLYIYCSFGGSQEEYENWRQNNSNARGLHTDAQLIENKLGLKNFEIFFKQKLVDSNVDSTLYVLKDDIKLIFIKGEVFEFTDYLQTNGIELPRLNLILSYASGFDETLKNFIKKFHFPDAKEESHLKFMIINNHYLNDIQEFFLKTEFYQNQEEFVETISKNYIEKYFILYQSENDMWQVKTNRIVKRLFL